MFSGVRWLQWLTWPARILRWMLVPRSTLPVLGSVVYVGLTSLRASGMDDRFAWLTSVVAFAIAFQRIRLEKKRLAINEVAREQASPDGLLAIWALAIGIASLGAAPGLSTWNDLFGAAAMGVSSVLAVRVLSELREPGGMLATPVRWSMTKNFFPPVVAIAWGLVGFDELRAALVRSRVMADEAADLSGLVASLAAFFALGLALAHARSRFLELDVTSRATSYASRVALTIGAALAIVLAGQVPIARVGRLALPALALLGIAGVRHKDPVKDGKRVRRALALAIVGGPLLLLGSLSARGRDATLATAITGGVLLVVGALGPYLEEPLRPAQGVLLDAIANAEKTLAGAEPETAPRDVLAALRATLPPDGPSPQLWTLDPPRALEVDAAGYAHIRKAILPNDLLTVAAEEPHATVRTSVLEHLAVRRADLRALGTWMDRDDALSATLVMKDGEIEGVLILPRETSRVPLTLEEVVALKRLADGVAGALAEESRVARARERENTLRHELSRTEATLKTHEHVTTLRREINRLATSRLARPATVGIYSRIASHAHRELEDAAAASDSICILAASGVDPVPPVARAHLGGPRSDKPLVIVEGTSSREHDPARWRDPNASPLALANGGVLFLVDGASLPLDVQMIIGTALAEHKLPWMNAETPDVRDILDAVLILSSTRAPNVLLAAGDLDSTLASRFGAGTRAAVVLPRIADRPEDLRAVVADKLAREGLRTRGRPVGIDDAAFAILIEHPFSGDDVELAWMVQRLVQNVEMASRDVVRAADVRALLPPETLLAAQAENAEKERVS